MIRLACSLVALAALAALCAPGATGQVPVQAVSVTTSPPVAGAKIRSAGTVYTTDRSGQALVTIPPASSTEQITRRLDVKPPKRIAPGVKVRFARWYGTNTALTATFDTYHRVAPAYEDQDGETIDPERISSISLKASTGERREVGGGRPFWLHATRVVPYSGDTKQITWSIESVISDGTNVVNRSQQRFLPSEGHEVPITLLFYTATFSARDAFFGFPLGSSIALHSPDGSVRHIDLGGGAEVKVPSLPRGQYEVKVSAPGVSFLQPVTISRDQQIDLTVLSALDIFVAVFALTAVALGLLLVRRPALRARLRASLSSLLRPRSATAQLPRVAASPPAEAAEPPEADSAAPEQTPDRPHAHVGADDRPEGER